MAIRFKTTITFRDDSKKVYDCYQYPTQSGEYWLLEKQPSHAEYIPKETIAHVKVEDYWKN